MSSNPSRRGPGSYARNVAQSLRNWKDALLPTEGRRVNRHSEKLQLRRSDSEDGVFAPVPKKEQVCFSRAGRWRKAHEWDRDSRCVWCDREA